MKKRSWIATFVTLSSFVVINSEGLGVKLGLTDSQVEVLTSMQTALVEEIAVGFLIHQNQRSFVEGLYLALKSDLLHLRSFPFP